jgi:replicative superfamily II helicase
LDFSFGFLHESVTLGKGAPDEVMNRCLLRGIGYHHAGLLLEERKLIERALRQGTINVVVATTTLSAGINITTVSTVIIESVFRMEPGQKVALTGAQYSQMAGRIESQDGSVIVIQHTGSDEESILIRKLSTEVLGRIFARLLAPPEFDRYWLQCLYCFNADIADGFAEKTFAALSQQRTPKELDQIKAESKKRLHDSRLMFADNRITRIGMSIAGANFRIAEGLMVLDNLEKASKNCCFTDDVHMLYLCVPTEIGFATPSYREDIWAKIYDGHAHVVQLTIGLDRTAFNRIVALAFRSGDFKAGENIDSQLDRFYAACVLLAVIEERTMADIEKQFAIDRGSIESLHTNAATFAGQVGKFCELCGFSVLGAAIHKFCQRLNHAVKNELLPLMAMPSCNQNMARILYNQGIEQPSDLTNCTVEEVDVLLRGPAGMEPPDLALAYSIKAQAEKIQEFSQQAQSFEEEIRMSTFL